MNLGLEGKVALVGGASRGLGYACAEALANEGADLAICSRSKSAIETAGERLRRETGAAVEAVVCDQTDPNEIEALVTRAMSRYGRIDILVSNTGGPPPGLFADQDDRAWQEAFEGLVMSVVRLCRAVIPTMREHGWGRIVANTSFTVREPAERLVLSNALRAAVVGLSKTLSREVASAGVTVNCVCPGAFDTARLQSVFESEAAASGQTAQDVQAAWEGRIPIGRLSKPEELAALVAFLCSDRAASITGACLPIDGGMLRGLF